MSQECTHTRTHAQTHTHTWACMQVGNDHHTHTFVIGVENTQSSPHRHACVYTHTHTQTHKHGHTPSCKWSRKKHILTPDTQYTRTDVKGAWVQRGICVSLFCTPPSPSGDACCPWVRVNTPSCHYLLYRDHTDLMPAQPLSLTHSDLGVSDSNA